MSKGLLLVNLGTPDAPTPVAVRRYLREFLSDPFVIDLPAAARWLLLNLVILPFRPRRSAAAYRAIWTEAGSPLLLHSQALERAVAARLPADVSVALGMRYGRPSLEEALATLVGRGVDELTLFPLYPQYATSSTESTIARVRALLSGLGAAAPRLRIVPPFYDAPEFIESFAQNIQPVLAAAPFDLVLFSFHGLPERQITKLDDTGAHCLKRPGCCDRVGEVNRRCYRAQCFATARALARRLSLSEAQYLVSFQSRLTSKWIQPFTDRVLAELPAQGKRRVVVVCPAFVADCLETVEEIGLRATEAFRAAGGEALTLVPSLNAQPSWVQAVATLSAGGR